MIRDLSFSEVMKLTYEDAEFLKGMNDVKVEES